MFFNLKKGDILEIIQRIFLSPKHLTFYIRIFQYLYMKKQGHNNGPQYYFWANYIFG
jgi:hypothetical protein